MRKTAFVYCLLPFLCACASKQYAVESFAAVKKLDEPALSVPEDNEMLTEAKGFLSDVSSEGNYVYSPASDALARLLYEGKLDRYAEFVSQVLNIESAGFELGSLGAIASIGALDQTKKENYLSHGVSVFEGSKEECEASLADHFQTNVALSGNPGEYSVARVSLRDDFFAPLETKNLPFNGEGDHAFCYHSFRGKYKALDKAVLGEVTIRRSQMRFLLPDPSVPLSDIDPALLFSKGLEDATIRLTCPEFSFESSHTRMEEGRYFAQDASFEFHRRGIKGQAVTVHGPTATDPSFQLELLLDRPFYFASLYQNVPLFLGQVIAI